MEMKQCKKCNELKSLNAYGKQSRSKDGLHPYCKGCIKKDYHVNKDYHKEYRKKWYQDNREEVLEKNKATFLKNYHSNPEFRQNNINNTIRNKKDKYKNDPEYKILHTTRVRINKVLKRYNETKKNTTLNMLGCDVKTYKQHIEQQFTDDMSWDNYGTYWEIDHIVPLSKGGSFHYTNTQPLTITENRKKSNKL